MIQNSDYRVEDCHTIGHPMDIARPHVLRINIIRTTAKWMLRYDECFPRSQQPAVEHVPEL